jgi:hypothetical protein
MVTKLIDRRLNILALVDDGEALENVETLQPPLLRNRVEIFKTQRDNLLQKNLMNNLLKFQECCIINNTTSEATNNIKSRSNFKGLFNRSDNSKFRSQFFSNNSYRNNDKNKQPFTSRTTNRENTI